MDIDLRINDSPFNKRVTMNSIAKRNVCRVVLSDNHEVDIIVSAIYIDKDGIEWLQGINVSDIMDNVRDPDLSNIIFKLSSIALIEFTDSTVYDMSLTAEQASSIMRRTDKIVRLAHDGVLMTDEARRVKEMLADDPEINGSFVVYSKEPVNEK